MVDVSSIENLYSKKKETFNSYTFYVAAEFPQGWKLQQLGLKVSTGFQHRRCA